MTQGLTRAQLGVTDEMVAAYGETIFALSNNLQTRRGDPIREKDFGAIEAHRHELGMGDTEIAARIGLTPAQVTLIRNLEERRRFRTGHYHVLNALGGGRRYREERFVPFQDHFRFSEEALSLRAAFSLDPERVRAYIEQGWWGSDTFSGWLRRNARSDPDGAALVDERGTVSHAELAARVESLAAGLHHAGVRPGDVVAVQLPNVREHVEILLAVSALGAVTTTLYMSFRGAELAAQLDHSRARMLVAPARIGDFSPFEWLARHRTELPHLEAAVAVGGETPGALAWERLAAGGPPLPRDWREPTAADPFCSSTPPGPPRAPRGCPSTTTRCCPTPASGSPSTTSGPETSSCPRRRSGTSTPSTRWSWRSPPEPPTPSSPPSRPRPSRTPSNAPARPSSSWLPPTSRRARGRGSSGRWTSLRSASSCWPGRRSPPTSCAPLPRTSRTANVCQLWGMTELQAGLYTRVGDGADLAARSAGRASPGTEVRIADEHGREVARGEEGELQARGPSVFAGYYENPEATARAFTADGWFRSGDTARMDADGNVTLTGRVKDVINRGGVKYNPQEIELLVERLPGVLQCAIAPIPDERLGERACCYVVPRPGETVTLEAVCDFLLGKGIAKFKLPEHLEVVEEMPLTPTRKVIKDRLRPPLSPPP